MPCPPPLPSTNGGPSFGEGAISPPASLKQSIAAVSPQAPSILTGPMGRNKIKHTSPPRPLIGVDWEEPMRRLLREELTAALSRLVLPIGCQQKDSMPEPVQSFLNSKECKKQAPSAYTELDLNGVSPRSPSRHSAESMTEKPEKSQPSEMPQNQSPDSRDRWTTRIEDEIMKGMSSSRLQHQSGGDNAHRMLFGELYRIIDLFSALKEPERTGRLADALNSNTFHAFIAVVILVNAVYMGVATDHLAQGLERTPFMATIEILFTLIYTTEIVLKFKVHGKYFFCNEYMGWNIFDFVLVILAVFDIIDEYVMRVSTGMNTGFMRSLRILKAGKVLRIFRLVHFFAQLRLILNVLLGSMLSLFWSLVMMAAMYYICGLVFVQGVANYLQAQSAEADPETRETIELYFGSVGSSMLYMFMMNTGGAEWSQFYFVLTETGYLYSTLYMCFVAFSQVAFLNVLTALFVENATQIAKPDRDDRVLLGRQAALLESTQLTKLCDEVDKDGSGMLSHEEFLSAIADPESHLRFYIESEGLDVGDALLFFDLIKNCGQVGAEESEVDIKAFVRGLMKIRGAPTALDIQAIVWQSQLIYKNMGKHFKSLENMVVTLDHLESVVAKMDGLESAVSKFHTSALDGLVRQAPKTEFEDEDFAHEVMEERELHPAPRAMMT